MTDLQPGDRIDIDFVNALGESVTATVSRILSDQQEGLSPEAEDYILCWMEISVDDQDISGWPRTIAFRADWKYFLDGREVNIRKCTGRAL
jgi:hypothetical protein